jgi:beta-glucanase (GH16 family)
MKAPRNSNVIASLWTFRTPKWQDWRETRVEITPANASNAAGTNIIWGQNAAAYGNTSNSYKATTVTTLAAGATIFDDFHTYAVQMTPAQVTWSVDGTVIRTETGTGVKLPDMSMKLLINLWVFPSNGWGGGIPSANVYPMHSETDWIRFYKWDQEPTYPCSPTPSCLPVDDRDYAKNNAEDGVAAAPPW